MTDYILLIIALGLAVLIIQVHQTHAEMVALIDDFATMVGDLLDRKAE